MEEFQDDEYMFSDFNREDKIEVGKCLVPIAIDDYLKFDKRKYPMKYKKGLVRYWNREEFDRIPESQLKMFGEIYLDSISKGLDAIDVGKNLYEIGIRRELPGFIRKKK